MHMSELNEPGQTGLSLMGERNSLIPRIRQGTVQIVSVPLPKVIRSGLHKITTVWTVVLTLESGEEWGIGYALTFQEQEAMAIASEIASLFDYMSASDLGVRETWRRMWQHINHIGQAGPPLIALSILDTSLWDIAARRLGLSLYQLLGGEITVFPLYGSGGWLTYTLDELVTEADHYATAGYQGYKLKLGNPDWKVDLERVRSVVDAVGKRTRVMVDINQSWTPADAIRKINELDECGVSWIEEPVDAFDTAGLAHVRSHSGARLVAGETLTLLGCMRDLIHPRAVDVVMPDLMRCGGPSGMSELMMAARHAYLEVSPHLFPEVSAHIASAFFGRVLIEDIVGGWAESCFESSAIRSEGKMDISPCLGIGLRLRDDLEPVHRARVNGELL